MAVINTNVKALFSQMALGSSGHAQTVAMQQLSTGKRINSARDDAAGMAIATRMTHQIRSLNQAVRNANDAINLIQTAEGATNEITDMLQRMRELAVQAVNDTNDNAQRSYLDLEFQQLKQQIVQIADNTEWNGFPVLTGAAGQRVGEMPVFKTTSVSLNKPGPVFIGAPSVPNVTGNEVGQKQSLTFTGTPPAGPYKYTFEVKDSTGYPHKATVSISETDATSWDGVLNRIKSTLDGNSEFADLTSSIEAQRVGKIEDVTFPTPLTRSDIYVNGEKVTFTQDDIASNVAYANKIKTTLEQTTAFGSASGRQIAVDQITGKLSIKYAVADGDTTTSVKIKTAEATQFNAGVTENTVVSFRALPAGETISIGPVGGTKLTYTAPAGGSTANEVAAAFAGWTENGINANFTGDLTDYSITRGTNANDIVFASTDLVTANVTPDLEVTVSSTNATPPTVVTRTQGTSGVTETATVTFAALTAGQQVTVAGLTYVAPANGSTAAQVATAFANWTPGTPNPNFTGSLNGYVKTSSTDPTKVVFVSTTSSTNVAPDLTPSASGAVAAGAALPTASAVDGTGGTKEVSTVTFFALTKGQTITVAGLTYVAPAGGSTADEVAAAFANWTAGAANFTSGSALNPLFTKDADPANANKVIFTGVANGNLAAIVPTSVAVTAPAAPTASITQGVPDFNETTIVQFGALAVGQTVTVGGLTYTATTAMTADDVADAYMNYAASTLNFSGTLTGYNTPVAVAGQTSQASFVRNVPGNLDDLVITASAGTPLPSKVLSQGVFEQSLVTFADMEAGQTVTVGGLTYTAPAGGTSASDVADAFATWSAGAANFSGSLTDDFTATALPAPSESVLFTSTKTGPVSLIEVTGSPLGTVTSVQTAGYQVALNFMAAQGDLSTMTVTSTQDTGSVPSVVKQHPALQTAIPTWNPIGGKFLKSGTLTMNVLENGEVQAKFLTATNDPLTLIGKLNSSNGTVTFTQNEGHNGDVLSADLTYAFTDAQGVLLNSWKPRNVAVNVSVEGQIPAMRDGDLFINGVNIGASSALDDKLSPPENAAGSAIAKAAAINRMAVSTGTTTGEQQTITFSGAPKDLPSSIIVGGVSVQLHETDTSSSSVAAAVAAAMKGSGAFMESTGRVITYQPGSSVITVKFAKNERDVPDITFNAQTTGMKAVVDTTVQHFTAVEGTGVFAKVNENILTGTAMSADTVVKGAVFINGYSSADITTVLNNTRTSRANVVRAINMISDQTGVKAIDTGSDAKGVTLVAADGRNIEVRFETKGDIQEFGRGTGLVEGVQAGTYSLESKVEAPIVLSTKGDITRTGLVEGNFTKNQSVVNTSTRESVQTATAQVDHVVIGGTPKTSAVGLPEKYSVTINNIQFTVTNNGNDLNTPQKIRNALVAEVNKKKDLIGVTASAGDSLGELKLKANVAGTPFTTTASGPASLVASATSSTLVQNQEAQIKPLSMNDLTINGIKIPQSRAADDIFSSNVTSSSDSSASAIAIAAAINSQSALTGVRAQANPVVSKASITSVSSELPAGRYSLYLNGTEVSVYLDPQDTPAERRANVADAINERTGQHGVVAADEGKGGLTLTTSDGRNLSAWFDSSVPALSAASFGLEKGGTAKQVSTVTFSHAATAGDTASIVVNDQTITVTATATQDLGALLKARVEENPYLKNIGVEVNGLTMTFTSKIGGSGFDLSGATVTGTTVTAMDIATTTPNNTGSNDISAIYRANETSSTARTLYGTVRMISDPALLPIGMPSPTGAPPSDKAALLKATGRPFTIAVGEDGFGTNSNFSRLGFEAGTFGGQSSAAMDPPRVGRMAFQVGASTKQVITIDLADFGKNGPITSEITGDVDLNVDDRVARINTRDGASDILAKLDSVMDRVNATRATMGAVMNRLDHVINNLTNVSMNLSASRSTIEDADYAAASTELAKTQIMQQAATAVLAQANTSQQSVLKLLGG